VAQLLTLPVEQIEAQTLRNLLEEFASRDGTDYGLRETPLDERVAQLQRQLESGELQLLYDLDSEHWDLVPRERARELLAMAEGDGA